MNPDIPDSLTSSLECVSSLECTMAGSVKRWLKLQLKAEVEDRAKEKREHEERIAREKRAVELLEKILESPLPII
jgi:hypothetical protein